jgi:hypothetical protein
MITPSEESRTDELSANEWADIISASLPTFARPDLFDIAVEAIAKYVELAIQDSANAEREACAKIADAKASALRNEGASVTADVVLDVADRIHARKDACGH